MPRARIELATHGSSGHVVTKTRNQAATRARWIMVTANDKWFNESGEQAPHRRTRVARTDPSGNLEPRSKRRADLQASAPQMPRRTGNAAETHGRDGRAHGAFGPVVVSQDIEDSYRLQPRLR